jgi:hypothetical protein
MSSGGVCINQMSLLYQNQSPKVVPVNCILNLKIAHCYKNKSAMSQEKTALPQLSDHRLW